MATAPTIAILAGGLATRMGALTCRTPKSLLDVNGRPFLAWQLELLASRGVRDVVLCISHHGEQIEEWCARHVPAELRVRFSRDGTTQVGTGGAIRNALPLLGDAFLVTYGDSYLRCDYLDVFARFLALRAQVPPPLALMTVWRNHDQFDASNVLFRDHRIVRYDKHQKTPDMCHIDWGLGAFSAQAFADFPREGALDLAEVYRVMAQRDRLAGYEVSERFYEIGSPAGLEELRAYLAR